MKWKDYPHLFANGKFKFRDPGGWDWDIVGICGDMIIGHIEDEKDTETIRIVYCTLIARPIESMTDEELMAHLGADSKTYYEEVTRQGAIKIITKECIANSEIGIIDINLLDLGVYPFDQSHFDDGTVIDAREVTV